MALAETVTWLLCLQAVSGKIGFLAFLLEDRFLSDRN
jgi:hypothetical protein